MSPSPDSSPEPSAVDAVRDDFVRLWGSLGTFWGVSPTTARVFGWLFSREGGAEAEDIMDALDLSRGAVSMACKELRDWGLLHAERVAGSRRTIYSSERDLEKVVRHVVQIRKQREWDPILENLREWLPALESEAGPDAEFLMARLRAVESLAALADSMIERLLKGGTVTNLGLKVLVGGAQRRARKHQLAGDDTPRDRSSDGAAPEGAAGGASDQDDDLEMKSAG